jgi:hypothetical protein
MYSQKRRIGKRLFCRMKNRAADEEKASALAAAAALARMRNILDSSRPL